LDTSLPTSNVRVFTQPGSIVDILIASAGVCFGLEKADMRTKASERIGQTLSAFGSNLAALARAREIRTLSDRQGKLPLWQLAFLNHTKIMKYEALEKNDVSEPKTRQVTYLQYG
jgi:hypothetical protein